MSEIKWEAPPPGRGPGSAGYDAITAELKTRPGEWALIRSGVTAQTATNLRRQYPGFEFASRTVDGRKNCNIYGRYLAEVSA